MVEKLKICCPVCNSEPSREEELGIVCKNCNFEVAFARHFAGQASKDLWLEKVKEAKNQRKQQLLCKFAKENNFILTNDSVSFLSSKEKKLTIVYANGQVKEEQNIVQYSSNERNSAWLYEDGTVKVTGDNSYGQCNTADLKQIRYILVGPNCIYAVGQNGKVFVVGALIDQKIKNWENIVAICCGAFHVLGLTKEGKVRIAGEMIDQAMVEQVSKWNNVKAITATTDGSVALFEDGTIDFAGRQNDQRREATQWTNMISIKADSSYLIGLTKDGTVKLAGYCKPFLDMGRSLARNWENVMTITCSRSGFGAITEQGELLVAGTFLGTFTTVSQLWNDTIKKRVF